MGSSTMDDWKRTALYLAALLAALHCRPGNSQCEQTFINTGFGNYIVEAGVRTCFRCVFEGVEDPNTLWRIIDSNGLPAAINPSDGQVNGGVLTIFDPITIVPNTGVAFQNQRTLLCDRSFGTFLQYRNLLSRRGLVPPVIAGPTTVNESDSFILNCDRSQSEPVRAVNWFVNGSVVSNEQSSQLQVQRETLQFTNISRNYSGEYNCTIQDDRNNTVSSAENIIVQFEPDVATLVMSPHLSPVNRTLALSCTYNAVPPPTITWSHEGSPLDPSDPRITITSTTSRSVLSRDDLGRGEGGTYTCDATNVVGSSSVNIGVTVQVPPDPPTNVMVTSSSETTLGLSWVNGFDGNSAITGVRVDYTPGGGSTMSTTFPGDASDQSANLTSLLTFRTYTIRVHVMNDVGASGPGSTDGSTLSLRLLAPSVTLATPNSTTVTVDWQAPTVDPMTTDAISSWDVEYTVMGGAGMTQVVSDPSTTALTLTAEKGTEYSVRVAGVNVRERGEWSPFMMITTPVDPPTIPRNLMVDGTGAFALNVQWDAPSDNGGRPVMNYSIEIREVVTNGTPADFTSLTLVTDTTPTQFRYEVRNNPTFPLSENTTYEVRVTAANAVAGQGPSSTAVGTTQPIGEPQRIFTPPGTVNITNTSVTVTWEFPGGYVDRYNIQYKQSDVEWVSSSDVLNITVMGFRNQTPIFGLMPATMYNVRIRTLNANGESEWSPEANFTTLPTVIIDGPSSGTTMAGEQVVITCNVSPGVAVMWSRQDNQSLPNPPDGNTLRIPDPQPEDSGVYECSAGGVVALFTLMVEPPSTEPPPTTLTTQTMTTPTPGGIGTVVIIAVSVGGGAALFVFLFVVVLAMVCLCRWKSQRSNSGIYNVKNRKLPTWIETSNPNQFVPSTRPSAANGEETPAFDIPEDYHTHSSFNTLEKQNRIRRSHSPEDQTVGRNISYQQLDHQQPVVSVHDAAPHRNVKQSNLVSSYEIGSPTSFQYIPQDPSATEWPDSQAPHYANTVV